MQNLQIDTTDPMPERVNCAISVNSVRQLIDFLGGVTLSAKLLKANVNNVSAWVMRGQIASNRYVEHEQILAGLLISAPASLWGQKQL